MKVMPRWKCESPSKVVVRYRPGKEFAREDQGWGDIAKRAGDAVTLTRKGNDSGRSRVLASKRLAERVPEVEEEGGSVKGAGDVETVTRKDIDSSHGEYSRRKNLQGAPRREGGGYSN